MVGVSTAHYGPFMDRRVQPAMRLAMTVRAIGTDCAYTTRSSSIWPSYRALYSPPLSPLALAYLLGLMVEI